MKVDNIGFAEVLAFSVGAACEHQFDVRPVWGNYNRADARGARPGSEIPQRKRVQELPTGASQHQGR